LYQLTHFLRITTLDGFENAIRGLFVLLPPIVFGHVFICHTLWRRFLPAQLALQLPRRLK